MYKFSEPLERIKFSTFILAAALSDGAPSEAIGGRPYRQPIDKQAFQPHKTTEENWKDVCGRDTKRF